MSLRRLRLLAPLAAVPLILCLTTTSSPVASAAPLTLFVADTAGATDAFPCIVAARPCQTIAGALRWGQKLRITALTIMVGSGTFEGGFIINHDTTLQGAGAELTTISGGGPGISIVRRSRTPLSAVISDVTVTGAHGGTYGGIYSNSASLTVRRSILTENHGTVGGGIASFFGTLAVDDSTIEHNSSSNGGGIETAVGTLTLTNSTVNDNSAQQSGGIEDGGAATTVIVNSTIAHNTATYSGGGILQYGNSGDSLTVINSTITGNHANLGAGGINTYHATTNLSNTVLAGNTIGRYYPGPDCVGVLTDATSGHGGNFLGTNDGCSGLTNGVNGDQVGTPGAALVPKLGSLGDNGGPFGGLETDTMAPQAGSPLIGADDAATCLSTGVTGVNDRDQRGFPRHASTRNACDIGAYDTGGE